MTILDHRGVPMSQPSPPALSASTTISMPDQGYRGARRDRRPTREWTPPAASAASDLLPGIETLRARSRDMARNVMVAGGAIHTVVTNVVGEGLTLKPSIDREALGLSEDQALEWEKKSAREFALWSRSADLGGTLTFSDLQELAFRACLDSGDCLVVRRFAPDTGDTYGLKLALIEADRVANPDRRPDSERVKAGVQFGENGRVQGYYVANRHPGDFGVFAQATRWSFVPRIGRDADLLAIHLMTHLRPDQPRGMPYLAPVIEALKQLGDYTDAEVTAAVNAAMMVAFVESPSPVDEDGNPIIGEPDDERGGDTNILRNGATVYLYPGEKVNTMQPGRPNPNFDAFTMSFLRQTGVALELPFELMVKHFTASYSASRAALELAWQFFRKRRSWLVRALCEPVHHWFLNEAVARGRLDAPGYHDDPAIRAAWCGCQWIGPSRISLDPLKEANADRVDLDIGVKTRDQIVTERTGGSWQRKTEQLAREERARRDAGLGAAAAPPTAPARRDEDEDDDA
ncbi:lambda family phage portal protein [Stappia sp. 22II-S9-Z10]|nr:lambda family phage portal protein [Stappia sp. 22II-S9-Z10]